MTEWRSRIVGHGEEDPSQLLASPLNARVHPKYQQDVLSDVLDAVGWVQSVVVSQNSGHVLDGHLRVAMAISRNEPTVPVVYVDVDEREELLILATLDPISTLAVTDSVKLAELLESVETDSESVQKMLDDLLESAPDLSSGPVAAGDDPGEQIDRAEELREKWNTERGQLWQIGRHRLLCGDSTSVEDVARLMDGKRASVTLTDPPYNVGKDYGEAVNDARGDYLEFNRSWFEQCPSDAVVLTPGMVNLSMWYREIGPPLWLCSWRKTNQCSPSALQGFNTWEPLLVYGKLPKRVGHDSWDIPVTRSEEAHPVKKTVEAWRAFLDAFAPDGASVYEPFTGSGTTHVVAQQTGRICYGMELEPKYVAVALERLAGMGLEPRLI